MDFQKAVKNTLNLISGRVITISLFIITTSYLTRYLGSTEFGKYSLVYAYLFFFTFASISGIHMILVREISKDNTKAPILIGNSLILCSILSVISILIAWIILQFINYPSDIKNFIYIAGIGIFFLSISFIYTSIFQAYLEQKYQITVEVISKVILVIFTFLLIFLKVKLLYFFVLDIFIALIVLWGNRYFSKYFVKPVFNIDTRIWLNLLKEFWPIALSSLFTAIVMRIDQIFLYHFKGTESVGLYSAGVRIVESFNIIPIAIGSSILPLLSRNYINSNSNITANLSEFNKTYELSLKYTSFIIVPIAILITIFSKHIILLLYGEKFISTHGSLAILIWSSLWYFTGIVFTQALVATGNQKIIPVSAGSDTLFNILLNLILIPKYGIIGASLSTTISYVSGRIICYIFFRDIRWYTTASLKCLVKPLIYFLPVGLIIYLIFF